MDEQHLSELSVGTRVIYQGRLFVLAGFSPMGVVPRRLWLRDPASGRQLEVALEEVSPAAAQLSRASGGLSTVSEPPDA